MKARLVAVAALNAVLLAVAFSLFIGLQAGRGFDSFVLAGAGGRMQGIAREIETKLRGNPESMAPGIVDQVARERGVTLVLTENNGRIVAGPVSRLPGEVAASLNPGPPPPGGRRGPPPASAVFLVRAAAAPRYWAAVRMPIETLGDAAPRRGTLFFLADRLYTNPFFFDPRPLLTFAAIALLISAACWWPFLRRVSRDLARAELVTHQQQFLRDTAHELRSPIARMRLALDLLEAQGESGTAEKIARIREDVDEMQTLTSALLDAARAESAASAAPLEAVDVGAVIAEAVRMEARPGAAIDVSIEQGLKVKGRTDTLTRALANILRNAVFHAGAGGPISIDARRAGRTVHIVVADSGPGVPDESLEQLFTPFYRVDPSRARSSGGAGLGLAIARAAIEACGGRIQCRNRRPNGLEVMVDFPLYEDSRIPGQAAAVEVRRAGAEGRGRDRRG
jgi:two-component system sensor histidine kinase CpxA